MSRILIIEDEVAIADVERDYLELSGFTVEIENTGDVGLARALKEEFDLFILDLMLPGVDGFEICKRIRDEKNTPILMVSAKKEDIDKIRGLGLGADDYITKPFSATYLKARVKNLLVQRQKLQVLYRQDLMSAGMAIPVSDEQTEKRLTDNPETDKSPVMSPNDRKFMDRLVEFMEKNMDNGELIVDDFVHELAVSRSVFFKKLKTLTGLAPIEFIKEMRIKRATQLIEIGEFNMTQISYMVGINDPRYFSKCFKAQFGVAPSVYQRGVSNDNDSPQDS